MKTLRPNRAYAMVLASTSDMKDLKSSNSTETRPSQLQFNMNRLLYMLSE